MSFVDDLIARLNDVDKRLRHIEKLDVGSTNATNIASAAHGATLDAAPLDADEVVGLDSSASFALIRTTWTSIKAFLKTYFDTLYFVLAGTSGGQAAKGDTASGGNLTLMSTAHATKGKILFGTSAYDEANNRLGVGGASPTNAFTLVGGFEIAGAAAFLGSGEGLYHINGNGLALVTLGLNRIVVLSNGDVGIKTALPNTALTIYDTPDANWGQLTLKDPTSTAAGVGGMIAFAGFKTGTSAEAIWAQIAGYKENASAGNEAGYLDLLVNNGAACVVGAHITSAQLMLLGGLTSGGASVLGIKAGTSTNDAAVGGVLYVDSATAGSVNTGETTLSTYTLPAYTLAVNNQSLVIEAWGTIAANGNAKTISLYFGATVMTLFSAGANGGYWHIRATVFRTGAATQKAMIEGSYGLTSATTFTNRTNFAPTETLSGTVVIKTTGQGTTTNDLTQVAFKISWEDANT